MPARWRRTACALSLATGCVTGCHEYGAHPRCPADGDPAWHEVTSPHFQVVSDLPVTDSEAIARELETSLEAIRQAAFAGAPPPAERTTVVVFEDPSDLHFFVPPGVDGIFARSTPAELEAFRFIVFSGELSQRVRATLLHELTHDLVNRWFGWAPPWLSEGWAQYYSTTRVDGGFVVAGEALPGLTFTTGPDYFYGKSDDGTRALAMPVERVTPPSRLLAMGRERFYAVATREDDREDEQRTFELYIGVWAFLHLLEDGPAPYPERFRSFLRAVAAGGQVKEAWAETFRSITPEQMDRDFAAYLARRQVEVRRSPFRPLPPVSLRRRALGDAEVHLLWARLTPWNAGHDAQVRADFAEAVRLAPAWPDPLFHRAVFHLDGSRTKEAEADLRRAIRLEPRDPRFRLGMVALRIAEERARGGNKTSPAVLEALGDLEGVASSAYELVTVAELKRLEGDAEASVAFAARAVERAPIDPIALDAYASALAATGRMQQAAAAEERAVAFMPDDAPDPAMISRLVLYRARARSAPVR